MKHHWVSFDDGATASYACIRCGATMKVLRSEHKGAVADKHFEHGHGTVSMGRLMEKYRVLPTCEEEEVRQVMDS